MIFIIHYLALHVSDYHQSIISLAVAWMYIHATARLTCANITNALYSLLDDAPDDGLVIVRNV